MVASGIIVSFSIDVMDFGSWWKWLTEGLFGN